MPVNKIFQTDRRRILAFVLLANLLLAAGVALTLFANWQRNREGVQQILQAEATFWADAMRQRYDQLQTTCSVAQRQLQQDPALLLTPESWLHDMDALMPFIDGIALVTSDGKLLAVEPRPAAALPAAPDFTSSPGFAAALRNPGHVQIGLNQSDPLDPTQQITPARCALQVPHTSSTVVLVFNVGLQRALAELQKTLSGFGDSGRWVPAVGLLRSDGYLLARLPAPLPHTRPALARAPAQGVLAREIVGHPERMQGLFIGPVQSVGGAERIGAWQRLQGHDLVAFTSLPSSVLTALWWRQSWPTLAIWIMLLMLQLIGGALISRAVQRQRLLVQINAALAQANQAVAEAQDEATLLHAICRICVRTGGMALAWVGRPDASGQALILAAEGRTAYLDGLNLSVNAGEKSGRGPFGTAWREARAVFVEGDGSEGLIAPWLDRMQHHGLRSMAALPVWRQGRLDAVFSIYRDGKGSIHSEQRVLLEELARSLGRGLDRLDLAAAERKALESSARQQELLKSVLAQIDILMSARNDRDVLGSACTRLLETGLFAAVWVAQPDAQGIVRALAAGGNAADILATQPALRVDDTATHALARAWRSGSEAQDENADSPVLRPWAEFSLPGWTPRVLALPLRRGGALWAVLVLVLLNGGDLDDGLHTLLQRVANLIERALGEIDLKAALETEQAQQRYLARHDALTGLPNRLALEHHLPLAMARARRHKTLLVVGMMDLDDFKPVNDTHGHAAGDLLLRQLGERLKAAVREIDLVARLGGDEFVLVLEGIAQAADLPAVLERVHSVVETPFDLGNGVLAKVGMSLGLTLYPVDDVPAEVLLRHADAALYTCKAHKADRTLWWQQWEDTVDLAATRPADLPVHVDAYGEAAARLLDLIAPHIQRQAPAFVEGFFAALRKDPEAAALLAMLSEEELAHLRQHQHARLLDIMRSDLDKPVHQEGAQRTGAIHSLVGVSTGALVTSMGWYLQSLHELIAVSPLRSADRAALAQVATARLQRELQWQTEGAQMQREQYQQMLFGLEQMQPDLTQWADLARTVLRAVVELPGMAATVIYKPDAQGHFVPEFTAGAFDDYMQAIEQSAIAPLQLDPQSPFGQTPHPRCWRSEQIETNVSYVTDPRMAPWRAAAHRVGIRSSAAVPVKDSRGRMVAVMGLYGRYPGMFETQSMHSFLRGLEQLFERGLYGLMTRREDALLPASDRRAWRHRLFSGGLEMHYQPVVDLRSGKPTAMEALARLRLDDGRLIGPGQFLPSFGASELTRLFILGLEQALQQLARWDADGLTFDLSVNLPPEVLLMPDCAR
ncbi:MAG: diguanylate cyclase domain-containing protein, partial [Thiomonas sp.]